MANLLNNYKQDYVGHYDCFNQLETFVKSQYVDGKPYNGEYLDEKQAYGYERKEPYITIIPHLMI